MKKKLINENISINFSIPSLLQYLIEQLEEAENKLNLREYNAYANSIESLCYDYAKHKIITWEQFDLVCSKYSVILFI